jgi:hypothetical protein
MNDPKTPKPIPPPGMHPAPRATVPPARTPSGSSSSRPAPVPLARRDEDGVTGKVVHDERGNAMWDWVKQTGKHAIESTTRMLRKLEVPELKFEDPKDEELRIMPDPSTGGGYDPYNQDNKPARKGFGKK